MAVKKILIVDPDPKTEKSLRQALNPQVYEIISAVDGPQGLAKTQTENPDIIFLETLLKTYPGHEFVDKLRVLPGKERQTPVVVMAKKESMQGFYNKNDIQGFIKRPCDIEKLVEELDQLFGSTEWLLELQQKTEAEQKEEAEKNAAEEERLADLKPQMGASKGASGMAMGDMLQDDLVQREIPKGFKQTIAEAKGAGNLILLACPLENITHGLVRYLEGLRYDVLVATNLVDAMKEVDQGHSCMILAQLLEESEIFDAQAFYSHCKESASLRSIPFFAFCYESVPFEEQRTIPMDRVIYFSEFDLTDLKPKIRDSLSKFDPNLRK